MAKAQELTALPDKIQGNWALPDCGIYDEALLFTRYFYLKSSPEGLSLRPAGLDRQAEDYMILSLSGAAAPVQIEDDGILTLGVLERPPARRTRNWPRLWERLPHDQTVEYTACTQAPSVVPKNMVRLMRFVDRLRDACAVTNSKDCARVAFKLADSDNNNRLSRAEILAATESLMLFAEMGAQTTLDAATIAKMKERAQNEGEKIATDLMTRYDANKSGDLDYNEIVDNFTPPALPVIRDMAEKAGNLLPALRVAATTLPRGNEAEEAPAAPKKPPQQQRKHY
ncbi:MAG: hypothetical protein ACK4PK_08265 [Alphaproteobacteria bacterium]